MRIDDFSKMTGLRVKKISQKFIFIFGPIYSRFQSMIKSYDQKHILWMCSELVSVLNFRASSPHPVLVILDFGKWLKHLLVLNFKVNSVDLVKHQSQILKDLYNYQMVKLYQGPNGEIFSFGMEVSSKLKFLEKKENHVTIGNGYHY